MERRSVNLGEPHGSQAQPHGFQNPGSDRLLDDQHDAGGGAAG